MTSRSGTRLTDAAAAVVAAGLVGAGSFAGSVVAAGLFAGSVVAAGVPRPPRAPTTARAEIRSAQRRQQDCPAASLRLVPEHPRHIEKNDDDDWHAEKPKNDAFHKSSPKSRCQWNY